MASSAATMVHEALKARPAQERPSFLRDLLAHTAAGLIVIEGARSAADATYRLADEIATQAAAGDDPPPGAGLDVLFGDRKAAR